jgi:hypothetical protein
MQVVGDAFKNNAPLLDSNKEIVVLGISTWGSVKNKELLISDKNLNRTLVNILTRIILWLKLFF